MADNFNFDPFVFGGGEGDGDAEILALFRQWIGESLIADGFEDGSVHLSSIRLSSSPISSRAALSVRMG